jgi:CIC family chloride channel protein
MMSNGENMNGWVGSLKTHIRVDFLRLKSSEYLFMILLAVLIGVGGGFGAIGFRYLIRLAQWGAFRTWNFSLEVASTTPWYILIFIPAIGGLVIYPFLNRFAREAKGHGVPEVMEAVALRGGVMRPRIVVIKALASAICIGTGGSVGREGPIVQIGSAFGSTVAQILHLSPSKVRTLVGCGAAAGIAGTFNAPIAGPLFALEVILRDFRVSYFTPIVISSVISTVICRHFLGDMPAFVVLPYKLVSAYELLNYGLLGLMAGAIGVTFTNLLYKTEDFFEDLKVPSLAKPLIGGLIIGSLAVYFPEILGVGYEAITKTLAGKVAWYFMFALILVKLAATSVTLASGGSGGIFAPSLFLGSMTGGFLGTIFHSLSPSTTAGAGAYAMVGMGAVVSATTQAPLTGMIIIFEMTGNYKIVPPLMVACVISTVLASRLKSSSIYTEKLFRRGIKFSEPPEINLLRKLPVTQILTPKPATVSERTGFEDLMNFIVTTPHSEFFVLRNENQYAGTISVHHLRKVLFEGDLLNPLVIARDMADSTYPTLRPDDTLDIAMKLFTHAHINELPVVDGGKFYGSVRKSDVLETYHQELTKRDLSSSFYGSLACATRTKCVDLGEGYMMAEMEVPSYFVGQTLGDLNIRSNYGVQVILVRQSKLSGKEGQIVPFPDYAFKHGDVLLVAGPEEKLQYLS